VIPQIRARVSELSNRKWNTILPQIHAILNLRVSPSSFKTSFYRIKYNDKEPLWLFYHRFLITRDSCKEPEDAIDADIFFTSLPQSLQHFVSTSRAMVVDQVPAPFKSPEEIYQFLSLYLGDPKEICWT
jgi:hypothetical protein